MVSGQSHARVILRKIHFFSCKKSVLYCWISTQCYIVLRMKLITPFMISPHYMAPMKALYRGRPKKYWYGWNMVIFLTNFLEFPYSHHRIICKFQQSSSVTDVFTNPITALWPPTNVFIDDRWYHMWKLAIQTIPQWDCLCLCTLRQWGPTSCE